MGLFRCPKCDAICHTDEEVCHLCGYRLKPIDESKVEEKPIEEAKQESKTSQKIELNSGFSRKSIFNSVSFDKKEDKKEEPKEDIFAAYFNQPLDNTEKVEPEPIKEEKVELKAVEAEVVEEEPTKDIPIEEEKVVDITPVVVAPAKESNAFVQPKEIIEPKVEEQPKVEEKPKVVEQPKVEEKPKPTTINAYTNTGYKPASSSEAAKPTPKPTKKKKEPSWVYQWRFKVQKNRKTAKGWAIAFFCMFLFSLILVGAVRDGSAAEGFWIFSTIITAIGLIAALIAAIVFGLVVLYVKQVEGYYVLVYGHSNDYRLILENRVVDRQYGPKYADNSIKLSGRLPDKRVVVATIFYQNYDRVIKIEILNNVPKK